MNVTKWNLPDSNSWTSK